MKRLIAVAVASAAIAVGASAQAAQYVVNGEFTQLSNGLGQLTNNTVATGWTVASGGYTFVFTQGDQSVPGQYGQLGLWDANNGGANTWNGLSAGGGNFAAIDSDFQIQPLTQEITGLTVGQTYNLSFNYAFGQQSGFTGPTVQSLTATVGDVLNYTTQNYNVGSQGFTGWQSYSSSFVADSTSELLSFVAAGNIQVPPFALVSNVSITGGVPEPATWAMMLIGIGGLGAMARRRRAASAVAA